MIIQYTRSKFSQRFAIIIVFVLGLSACAIPRPFLPVRELRMTIYNDGTCDYWFEGIRAGNRESWTKGRFQISDFIHCEPSAQIWMTRQNQNTSPVLTDSGNIVIQPEDDRSSKRFSEKISTAKLNNYRWAVWVALLVETGHENDNLNGKVEFQANERFWPCDRLTFVSTSNPNNHGLIYSEQNRLLTGIYMELTTQVKATQAGC